MPSNFDEVPSVDFSVDMGDFNNVRQVASLLAGLGIPEAPREFEREFLRAKAASKIFIRNAGAEEVDEAQKIESQKVGHSKSGYVPTGTLQGSITPQFSDDGLKVSVLPLATAQDAEKARQAIKQGVKKIKRISRPSKSEEAYYYGAAVEFGLGHNPKEPFMKPSGEKVIAKLDSKFEQTMREALE